jgi:hypothetical protein
MAQRAKGIQKTKNNISSKLKAHGEGRGKMDE